jgi:hypothetical protein
MEMNRSAGCDNIARMYVGMNDLIEHMNDLFEHMIDAIEYGLQIFWEVMILQGCMFECK